MHKLEHVLVEAESDVPCPECGGQLDRVFLVHAQYAERVRCVRCGQPVADTEDVQKLLRLPVPPRIAVTDRRSSEQTVELFLRAANRKPSVWEERISRV